MSISITLELEPDATFKAKVPIPVAGKPEPVPVEFEFRHMTRDALAAFLQRAHDLSDLDYVMAVAKGWELTDDFSASNVGLLLNNYGRSAGAIARTYLEELTGRKLQV